MPFDYRIQNFKAFPDSGTMPLRPITLVYGPNSSGKSSLLQSFLLLKQTLDEAENPETLLLPKGNLVDLGNYREFVHCHELTSEFAFTFNCPSSAPPSAGRPTVASTVGIDKIGVKMAFAYDKRSQSAVIASLDVYAGGSDEPLATFRPFANASARVRREASLRGGFRPGTLLRGERINENHPYWAKSWSQQQEIFKAGQQRILEERRATLKKRLETLQAHSTDKDSPEQSPAAIKRRDRRVMSVEETTAHLSVIENTLTQYRAELPEVIARFRDTHKRSFLSCKNFLPVDVGQMDPRQEVNVEYEFISAWQMQRLYSRNPGWHGGATAVALEACRSLREFLDDIVYVGPLREYPERHYIFSGNLTGQVGKTGRQVADILFKDKRLLARVNEQLSNFDLGYELLVSGEHHTDVFSLVLKDLKSGVKANILDVGFGISQVLPVIVQSMLSRSKLVCIEQPEIHLHPRLQADLGSLLVECIHKPYDNRFLVETHSQHIVLRLQKLIRAGQLRPEEITVLYVDRSDAGAKCIELRLDNDGDFIDEWPGGFFEEGYSEIFA